MSSAQLAPSNPPSRAVSLVPQASPDELVPTLLPADRSPALVYVASLRAGDGRRTMHSALEAIARYVSNGRLSAEAFPWHQLRFQHTQAVRAHLAQELAPATANKYLAALRGALKSAWRLELMTAEDYRRAVDLDPVRGQALPRGRPPTTGELRALVEACAKDKTPAGARDMALLAVMYCAGLRRAEVVALELADYDPASGEIRVRAGKGGKDRIDYAGGGREAIAAWLAVRGEESGPLFWPARRGGHLQPGRLGPAAVWRILAKRCAEAGVKVLSPHDLRRGFVSDLLAAGADLSTVQRLAGHASVTTTTRYDRRPEQAKRQAAELLHFPQVNR